MAPRPALTSFAIKADSGYRTDRLTCCGGAVSGAVNTTRQVIEDGAVTAVP